MDTKLQKQRPVTFLDFRLISRFESPLKDYGSGALKFVTTQTIPSRGLTISSCTKVGFWNAKCQENRGGETMPENHELGINEKRTCHKEDESKGTRNLNNPQQHQQSPSESETRGSCGPSLVQDNESIMSIQGCGPNSPDGGRKLLSPTTACGGQPGHRMLPLRP